MSHHIVERTRSHRSSVLITIAALVTAIVIGLSWITAARGSLSARIVLPDSAPRTSRSRVYSAPVYTGIHDGYNVTITTRVRERGDGSVRRYRAIIMVARGEQLPPIMAALDRESNDSWDSVGVMLDICHAFRRVDGAWRRSAVDGTRDLENDGRELLEAALDRCAEAFEAIHRPEHLNGRRSVR